MKPEYADFLTQLIEHERGCYHESQRDSLTPRDLVRARCGEFTQEFVEKFPHLKRVAGFVGGIEHWWCVDIDGAIVDPTAEQFHGEPEYVPYIAAEHEVRLGRCMNCGDEIYGLSSGGPQCMRSEERRVGKECRSRWSP